MVGVANAVRGLVAKRYFMLTPKVSADFGSVTTSSRLRTKERANIAAIQAQEGC